MVASLRGRLGAVERDTRIDDKNFLLLGIKYEAALLGGVDEVGLARIEEQIRTEIGDSWATDEQVVRGRNAVRAEHGLDPLGEPPKPSLPSQKKRTPWRRLFGG